MKKRHSGERIIKAIKKYEAGAKLVDLCRYRGVSAGTLYNWRSKYAELEVNEAKRLRELEAENSKLKRLLADKLVEAETMKDLARKKVVKPASKEPVVSAFLDQYQLSERRGCYAVGLSPTWLSVSNHYPDLMRGSQSAQDTVWQALPLRFPLAARATQCRKAAN